MCDKLVDVEKMAEILGVPITWVYSRTRNDEIPNYKFGKYRRFDPVEVLRWYREKMTE